MQGSVLPQIVFGMAAIVREAIFRQLPVPLHATYAQYWALRRRSSLALKRISQSQNAPSPIKAGARLTNPTPRTGTSATLCFAIRKSPEQVCGCKVLRTGKAIHPKPRRSPSL